MSRKRQRNKWTNNESEMTKRTVPEKALSDSSDDDLPKMKVSSKMFKNRSTQKEQRKADCSHDGQQNKEKKKGQKKEQLDL